MLLQKLLQHFGPAFIAGQNHHAVVLLQIDLQVFRGSLGIARVRGQLLGRDAQKGFRLEAAAPQREGITCIKRVLIQRLPDLLWREAEAFCVKGAEAVLLQSPEILAQLFAVFLCHLAAAGGLVQEHHGILRDIVKTCRRRIQHRQPAVQIRHGKPIPQLFGILPQRCCNLPGCGAAAALLVTVCKFFHLPAQDLSPAGGQGR